MDGFPIGLPPFATLPTGLQLSVEGLCRRAVPLSQPYLLHMIGLPGAGKSSLLAALQDLLPLAVPLSFDRLMTGLADYQRFAAQDEERAFHDFEVPARQAGYHALQRLLQRRAAILFEHSAAAEGHPVLLHHAKEMGYRVVMAHLEVTPESAARRVQARGGRHTPPDYIPARARLIAALYPAYETVADAIIACDNPDLPPAERNAFYRELATRVRAALLDSAG